MACNPYCDVENLEISIDCCTLSFVDADNGCTLKSMNLLNANIEKQGNKIVISDGICISIWGLSDIEAIIPIADIEQAIKDCRCGATMMVEEPPKTYLGKCFVQDPEDKKNVIALYEWVVTETGLPCFTTDDKGLDIIDINEYEIMSTVVGIPMPENLAAKVKGKSFEYCPEAGLVGTLQDLLDEAIARGLLLPDGTVPTGAVKVRILAEYAGQIVNGKKTSATGITVTDGGEDFSLDGGQDWCTEEPQIDADCDGFLGLCVDLTTPVEFPVGAGAVVEIVGAPCDADDTDDTVQ